MTAFFPTLRGVFKRNSGKPDPSKNEPESQISKEKRQALMSGSSMESSRGTLRSVWKLLRPYWVGNESSKKEKAIAYSLLAATIAATIWTVGIQVEIANWSREFGDTLQNAGSIALQNKDLVGPKMLELPQMQEQLQKFTKLLTTDFVWLVGKLLTSIGISFVVAQHLALRWRAWMTEKVSNDWLNDKAFYRLQSIYKNTENPDQRIQEDVARFTGGTLSLVTDALGSTLSLGTFSAMLWGLSSNFNLSSLGGPDLAIPGFMFWAAAAYAGVGTYLTHKIGKPLVKLDNNQQKYEAFFRSDLIRVRENAEQIALNNGETVEKKTLKDTFNPVYENAKKVITKRKQLILSRAFYNNLASPFPYIVTAPLFFTGKATLGTLHQVSYAFGQVQSSLSWFIDNYQTLASWKASTDRLSTFTDAIEHSKNDLDARKIPVAATAVTPAANPAPSAG